jgi:hypothetical protein
MFEAETGGKKDHNRPEDVTLARTKKNSVTSVSSPKCREKP